MAYKREILPGGCAPFLMVCKLRPSSLLRLARADRRAGAAVYSGIGGNALPPS